ncbi:MAG: tyrosine-type recombinase/integrase, partial [Candidatus Heimdallarchaeaceae archaeon]
KRKYLIANGNVTKIRVPGMKTEERIIPIVHSLGFLHKWFEIHPDNDPEAWIFIGESRRYGQRPLTRIGALKLVNRAFEKAGVKKRHNLHWFRHSRATLLAPHMSEVVLCKYMGWVLGSKQVKRYVHIGQKELDMAYYGLAGLKVGEDKQLQSKPKKCVCGTLNETIASYCYRCGQPIDVSVAIQDSNKPQTEKDQEFNDELNKSIKLLLEIAKNPELMKRFEKFIARV